MGQQRLVARRKMTREDVARMELDRQNVDERSRASELREVREMLLERRLECGDRDAVKDRVR